MRGCFARQATLHACMLACVRACMMCAYCRTLVRFLPCTSFLPNLLPPRPATRAHTLHDYSLSLSLSLFTTTAHTLGHAHARHCFRRTSSPPSLPTPCSSSQHPPSPPSRHPLPMPHPPVAHPRYTSLQLTYIRPLLSQEMAARRATAAGQKRRKHVDEKAHDKILGLAPVSDTDSDELPGPTRDSKESTRDSKRSRKVRKRREEGRRVAECVGCAVMRVVCVVCSMYRWGTQ